MPRRRWSRQTVIEAIRDRQRRGLPMTCVQKDDSGLAAAGRKWFGSWPDAVLAAGLQPKVRRTWSRESVLEAIRDWRRRGLPLADVWTDDKGLYLAARRRFGSWCDALLAAGLPVERREKWSRERVIAMLQEYERQGVTNIRKRDKALAGAVTKYFGTLKKARLAAGLEKRRRMWSDKRIIETIQDQHVRGLPQSAGHWNCRLASAAARHFGCWDHALVAAGFRPKKRVRWTKDLVLHAIRSRHRRGLSLTVVWKEEPSLSGAAYRIFGGWHEALAAAGITPEEATETYSREPNKG